MQYIYKTTDDILIAFDTDLKAKNHIHIEKANEKITFNRQHDVNNLMLAEGDANKFREWLMTQEKTDIDYFKQCSTLANLISIIAKEDDTFNTIHDLNGNLMITYSKDGLVHLPTCFEATEIELKPEDRCYKDQPIAFTSQNKTRKGYLTYNNYIKEDSIEVNCKLIAQYQILPGNLQLLIRNGSASKTQDIKGLIFHNITTTHKIHNKINLKHHGEIIENYSNNNEKDEETNSQEE